MGLAERRKKDGAMAAYMKKNGVDRRTMACPRCHGTIGIGTKPLLSHLNTCTGRRKAVRRVNS